MSHLTSRRMGSPFREFNSPIVYGLLAHAHDWNAPASTPSRNVENVLRLADADFVTHPSEMPDLLCVANLGTWVKGATAWIGPGMKVWSEQMANIYDKDGAATTAYIGHTKHSSNSWAADQPIGFTPIGAMISYFLTRLAADDASLRRLALYIS